MPPVLHVEIAERGYTGGYKTLARYLRPLRCVDAGGAVAAPRAAGSAPGRRLDHRPSESA
jgi:hypothetical protein